MPNFYPLFIAATALLMLTPGPNVALIVANSVAYGVRYGLLTVLGTTAAVALHLIFVGIGMTEGLSAIGTLFEWVRWAGVAYLVILGVQTWRASPVDLTAIGAQPKRPGAMLGRAVIVSLTNPKTLLFYGAFFPQFVAPDRPIAPQLWILCVTFVLVAAVVDSLWAWAAARARLLLAARGRLRNRVSGGILVGAGLGLALTRPR